MNTRWKDKSREIQKYTSFKGDFNSHISLHQVVSHKVPPIIEKKTHIFFALVLFSYLHWLTKWVKLQSQLTLEKVWFWENGAELCTMYIKY